MGAKTPPGEISSSNTWNDLSRGRVGARLPLFLPGTHKGTTPWHAHAAVVPLSTPVQTIMAQCMLHVIDAEAPAALAHARGLIACREPFFRFREGFPPVLTTYPPVTCGKFPSKPAYLVQILAYLKVF